MSGKRGPTSVLTRDNWDEEEVHEEKLNTFAYAPADELKTRVIKKARRHTSLASSSSVGSDNGSNAKAGGIFSNFTGFSKPSPAGASPFSFLSKLTSSSPLGGSGQATASSTSTSSFKATTSTEDIKTKTAGNASDTTSPTAAVTTSDTATEILSVAPSHHFCSRLRQLNREFANYIKSKVDEGDLIILSPTLADYEKHLKTLWEEDKTYSKSKDKTPTTSTQIDSRSGSVSSSSIATSTTTKSVTSETSAATTSTAAFKNFSFTSGAAALSSTKESEKSNGLPSTSKASSFSNLFSKSSTGSLTTGSADSTDNKTGGFSFNLTGSKPSTFSFTPGSTPFSFGNIQPPASSSGTIEEEDDEEEPPKVEFKPVVEEDATYSKRCKVFVKKGNNYVDRGVGTLYLKPVKDSEKTQLLVRADTNLGNILVNLILSAGIPSQRMGKNNVMLVCLPTPDVEKATSMLLRVKTAEDADELFEKIEKCKKKEAGK